jgi:thymidylate synthase
MKAGEFIHTTSDTHIYENHIQPLVKQLENVPFPFPKVSFPRPVANIEDWTIDNIVVEGYKSHGKVELEMAV